MIRVVNIKTYRYSDYPGQQVNHVYIGRAMPGRPGSPLANQRKLRHESEREEVLAWYQTWLDEQLKSDTAARREIDRLADLARDGDLTLGCWCKQPDREVACHGDPVKRAIEKRLRERREALINKTA